MHMTMSTECNDNQTVNQYSMKISQLLAVSAYIGGFVQDMGSVDIHESDTGGNPATLGHMYSSCLQSAMLNASETCPLTKTNLQHNHRAMIRQICSIKPENVATVRSRELLAKLKLKDLDLILRERVWICGAF